ncbi:MAG TPA: OmpA family protein [Legionellaceae bacterium]|nr:OmpA family protein [Legionellaceae bacterium]
MIKYYLHIFSLLFITYTLVGCFKPPFNEFQKPPTDIRLYRSTKKYVIKQLEKQDIQYVEYGDTMTLIVPTDHYFVKGSAELNDICYAGLNNIIKLLKMYPKSRVYVAAFTDDVGSTGRLQKHRSQARAESMLTFLWANGIPAKHLHAQGYGDLYPIGDNHLIHSSAYNRRIEIQWFSLTDDVQANSKSGNYHGMK